MGLRSPARPLIDTVPMYFKLSRGCLARGADAGKLALQVSWEVLHGQQKSTGTGAIESGDTGIFVSIQQMEYGALASPHLHSIGPFSATGGPFSVAAGRMSFTYGLKGPAVSLCAFNDLA